MTKKSIFTKPIYQLEAENLQAIKEGKSSMVVVPDKKIEFPESITDKELEDYINQASKGK